MARKAKAVGVDIDSKNNRSLDPINTETDTFNLGLR